MTHSRNDRNGRLIDGIGNPFIVKGPKVFNRAAASTYDQYIRKGILIGVTNGIGNLPWRLSALHPGREQTNPGERIPGVDNAKHIPQRCAYGAGYDANNTGVFRQLFFVAGIKKALR